MHLPSIASIPVAAGEPGTDIRIRMGSMSRALCPLPYSLRPRRESELKRRVFFFFPLIEWDRMLLFNPVRCTGSAVCKCMKGEHIRFSLSVNSRSVYPLGDCPKLLDLS